MKKLPSVDVHKKASLFMSIGLCISLLLVIFAFEWKFYDEGNLVDLGVVTDTFDTLIDIPPTEQPPPPPPPASAPPQIVEVADEEEIEDLDIDLDIEVTEEDVIEQIVFEEPVEEEIAEEILTIVEEMPTPVGGYDAFYEFVLKNLKYPPAARKAGVEGKVFLQIIVGKDGAIQESTVVKGIGFGCDEEALRVVKSFGKWNPGKQRGRPVVTKFFLPLKFQLGA